MCPDLVAIGKVVGLARGTGEVKVLPLTDFPHRFSNLKDIELVSEEGERRSLTVEKAELKGKLVYLKFTEIDAADEARSLIGSTLEIPERELVPLPEGVYYVFQLIGFEVVNEKGEPLGELVDVLSMPANDVWVVRRDDNEYLLPAVKEFVKRVDLERGEVVISPIPGLLD